MARSEKGITPEQCTHLLTMRVRRAEVDCLACGPDATPLQIAAMQFAFAVVDLPADTVLEVKGWLL